MARAVHERAHAAHQRHAKKYVWWSSIIQDGQTGPDANSNVNLLSSELFVHHFVSLQVLTPLRSFAASTTIPLATPTAQSANSVTSSPTSKTSTTQSVFAGTRSNLNVGAIVPASSSLTAARKSRTPRPSTTSSKKHPALFSARLPPGRHLSSSPKIQKRVYQGAAILQDGDTLPLPTAADTPQASLVAPTFAPLGPDDEITVTKEIDGESFTVVIGAQATSTLVDAVEQALPTDTAASVAPTTANVSSESASSSDAESSVEEPSSTSSAAEAQETAATESVVDSTVPQSYTQAQMQTLASLYASFLQLLGL